MKIISQKILFKNALTIEEGTIASGGNQFKRERLNRQDASAILIFNTDTNKIILTRQFRYAIQAKSSENILEIVAGKIDGNDSPEETALRETEEETGFRVHRKNLKLLLSCFTSPGYSSEQFYIYYATVTNADKVSEGGGLKEENESIEVVEMDAEKFKRLLLAGEIRDAKTYIAGLLLMQNERKT